MEKIPLPLRLRQLKILPQPFLISEKKKWNGMYCKSLKIYASNENPLNVITLGESNVIT